MEETHLQQPQANAPLKRKIEKKDSLWDLVRFAIIAALIVLPIRFFIAQPFIVSGSSMVPTFQNGQYLIVDELSYRLGTPARGDVIIFRPPIDPTKFYIKRVIGLPGETVTVSSTQISITNSSHPQGFTLDEPYIVNIGNGTPQTVALGDKEYFALGDNRTASYDSRKWGPVPEKNIVGRAFLRLVPLKTLGILPGEYSQAE